MLKAIETFYNGYRFRSRLEARWAVFFDSAGIEYVYEPEGFKLDNGLCYLPDFLIRNVIIVHGNSEPRIIPEMAKPTTLSKSCCGSKRISAGIAGRWDLGGKKTPALIPAPETAENSV